MKYREFTMRKITILLALTVGLAFTACDAQTVQTGNKNNNNGNVQVNNNQGNNNSGKTPEVPEDEDEGHGPDDDAETLEPGALSGTWRVATVEDDTPVAHFDLIHVKGETEISGEFMMGVAIHEDLADEVGEIIDASFADNKLELVFNPTTDEEEFYVISATERIDDDQFKGKLTAQRNVELSIDVIIKRQIVED